MPSTLKPREDNEHLVSTIDLFPTIMDMVGGEKPPGLNGSSFLPLLQGKEQKGKDMVFTEIDYLSNNKSTPMRCIQDKEFGYIFNPWSDGKTIYRNANEGETFKAMIEKGRIDPEIQSRVNLFRYRTPEEFYDLKNDPNSTHNLVNDQAYTSKLQQYRSKMKEWMKKYNDPLLQVLDLSYKSPRKCDS